MSPARLWLVIWLVGCGSDPPGSYHPVRGDGGLTFEKDDLSTPASPSDLAVTPSRDLAGAPTGDLAQAVAPDLAGTGGACATVLAAISYDFESGAQGFTHKEMDNASSAGAWPYDEWQLSTPSGPGPGACHGGTKCWGTYLAGNYANCERGQLVSPVLDLSACAGQTVKLTFWHYFDFWDEGGPSGHVDGGRFEVTTDGASWDKPAGMTYPGSIDLLTQDLLYMCNLPNQFELNGLGGYIDASGGWQQVTVTLPSSLMVPTFQFRFGYATSLISDETNIANERPNNKPGWYVDDIALGL